MPGLKSRLFFLLFLVCGVFYTGLAQAASIEKIRFGTHAEKTRIVFELSGRPAYKAFTVENPTRLVVDWSSTSWRAPLPRDLQEHPLVRSVQQSQHDANTTRVVIETATPIQVTKEIILPPYGSPYNRYVIDIAPRSAASLDALARRVASESVQLPTPTRKSNYKPMIVIDPGHGGRDPGAIGATGVFEKSITLIASKELRDSLLRTGRYRVHLTRSDDRFIRLRDRTRIAQQKEADLFISVHADAARNRSAYGASIYTLSEKASDKEAAALARKENRADLIAGVDFTDEPDEVTSILIDLVQRETMNLSKRFATIAARDLGKAIDVRAHSHRFAGFVVLKAPDTPSVLLELGYLSNPKEEWLLKQRSHRAKIVRALTKSIDSYFDWKRSLE